VTLRLFKLLASLFIAVFASACVQAPKKQAFNAAAHAQLKEIVVAHNINQDEYPAIVIAHPGTSFGLIGGLIAAADMQSKSNRLTQALNVSETRLQERFSAQLKEKLEQSGYQVSIASLKKDTKFEDALAQVKEKKLTADAILVAEISGRYIAAGPNSDYFPFVSVKVTKYENSTSKVLYEDTFTYGYNAGGQQTVHLASASEFKFSTIDTLIQDPAKTRLGLLQGVEAIASQITSDLKK
jgi:hypothetical protein